MNSVTVPVRIVANTCWALYMPGIILRAYVYSLTFNPHNYPMKQAIIIPILQIWKQSLKSLSTVVVGFEPGKCVSRAHLTTQWLADSVNEMHTENNAFTTAKTQQTQQLSLLLRWVSWKLGSPTIFWVLEKDGEERWEKAIIVLTIFLP